MSYGAALKASLRTKGGQVPVYGSAGITGYHDVALTDESSLVVGRKGSAGAVYHAQGPSFAIDTAYYCTATAAAVDLRFGYHLLTFLNLRSLDQSTAVPSLSRDSYNSVVAPVPPVETQHRIVARIDELFTELDDGEAALARAQDDLGIWRKALLKAAVTGELTADWRAERAQSGQPIETGADLLHRILADRDSVAALRHGGRRRDKATEMPSPEQKQLLWEAPHSWAWAQLGNFAFVTKLAGFEYTKFVQYDDEGDLRVIKAENAGKNGFKRTDFSRIKSTSVAELTRSRLSGGELLMVFVGAGTGNVGMVPDGEDFFLGPNIAMMRVETHLVIPRYVELFLRSPVGKSLAIASMKAVAQPSLSMGTIRQIPIAMPPFDEQVEILARLENALKLATEFESEIAGHMEVSASLRQSILSAAFRGNLVA